jgi:hypothetical protein
MVRSNGMKSWFGSYSSACGNMEITLPENEKHQFFVFSTWLNHPTFDFPAHKIVFASRQLTQDFDPLRGVGDCKISHCTTLIIQEES